MQLALTTGGDLDITGGRRRLIEGSDASKQAWRVGMRLIRGEWHLNRQAGFPWLEVVFVDRPSLLAIRAKLYEFALLIPGVVEVTSISLTPNTARRSLSGNVEARYEDGDIIRFQVFDPTLPLGGQP